MRFASGDDSDASSAKRRLVVLSLFGFPAVIISLLLLLQPPGASTKPPTDWIAKWNEAALAIPEVQRAWPVYESFIAAVKADDEANEDASIRWGYFEPTDPCWPVSLARLERFSPWLPRLHEAARRSTLGPTYAWAGDGLSSADWQDRLLLNVTIGHAVSASNEAGHLVATEVYAAAEAGDALTVERGLGTMHGLATQTAALPFTYAQLHSAGIFRWRDQIVGDLLARYPDILNEQGLESLQDSLDREADLPGFDGRETSRVLQNLLEVTFTNDGHGNGVATDLWLHEEMHGMIPVILLDESQRVYRAMDRLPRGVGGGVIQGAMGWFELHSLADRRSQVMEHDAMLVEFKNDRDVPLRDLPIGAAHTRKLSSGENGFLPMGVVAPWFQHLRQIEQRRAAERDAARAVLTWHLLGKPAGDPTHAVTPWPTDPMDGAPMRWRMDDSAGGLVLYSVGDDLDDGGRAEMGTDRLIFDDSYEAEDGDWQVFPPKIDPPQEIVPYVPSVPADNTDLFGGMGMGGMGMGAIKPPEPVPASNTPTGYRIDCGHEACRAFFGIAVVLPNDP